MSKSKKPVKPVRKRSKKPVFTKYAKLVSSTIQDSTHLSTSDVQRARNVLFAVLNSDEALINELSAQLAAARVRRSDTNAKIDALGAVIGRRQLV